jgi:hypothetical protein
VIAVVSLKRGSSQSILSTLKRLSTWIAFSNFLEAAQIVQQIPFPGFNPRPALFYPFNERTQHLQKLFHYYLGIGTSWKV